MEKTEHIIDELIQALNNHITDYNLTEDSDCIYTLDVHYSDSEEYPMDTIKFIVEPFKSSLLIELDDDEEPTGAVFTVDEFVTYVFS